MFSHSLVYVNPNAMVSGTIIVGRRNGLFYFHFNGRSGAKILSSGAYPSRASCEVGISTLRKYALDKKKYEKKATYDHKYYFVLKGEEGGVLATSIFFFYSFSRDKAMEEVKELAAMAQICDQS